tara:strand:- start:649 stop:810 length:162 start_codon:yes stop_codon:yes gene_type:complete
MSKELELEIAKLDKMIARRYEFLSKSYDLDTQRQHKSIIAELQATLDKSKEAN